MTTLKYKDGAEWKHLPLGGPSSVPIEPWITVGPQGGPEPAFKNGWAAYDSTYPVQFRKRPDGTVELRGLVARGTNGSVAFTLPTGYFWTGNPPYRAWEAAYHDGGAFGAGAGIVRVFNTGNVDIITGSTFFVSLDSVRFSTDQTTFPTGPQGVKGADGADGAPGAVEALVDSDHIGTVKAYAGKTIPENWMLCDGRTLSRTSYPDLFNALGGSASPWGLPDLSSFSLPDLRSRMIVGTGPGSGPALPSAPEASARTARTLALVGGKELHTLTEAQIPAHGHPAGNGHFIATSSGGAAVNGTGADLYPVSSRVSATGLIGGGTSHENMPPWIAIAYIIKVTGIVVVPTGPVLSLSTVPTDPWHLIGELGSSFGAKYEQFPGEAPVAFMKDPLGMVKFKGLVRVKSGQTPAGGDIILSVPTGYRPPVGDRRFIVPGVNAGNAGYSGVYVNATSGELRNWFGLTSVGPNSYIDLEVVEFDAETVTQMPTGPQGPQGPKGDSSSVPIEAWKTVGADGGLTTFTSPWVSYSATYPPQWRKRPDGTIECQGLVKPSTGAPINGVVFTFTDLSCRPNIPVSSALYRPATAHSGSAYVQADMEVQRTGAVYLSRVSAAIGTSGWLSINNLGFSTGQTAYPVGPRGPQGPAGPGGGFAMATPTDDWDTALLSGVYRNYVMGEDPENPEPIETINGPGTPDWSGYMPFAIGIVMASNVGTIVQTAWIGTDQWSRKFDGDEWTPWVPPVVMPELYTEQMFGGPDPYDGQERYFQNSAMKALGVMWKFRYNEASPSPLYKWEFVGGQRYSVRPGGVYNTNSTSYVDLGGIALAFPLPGDYKAFQTGRGGTSALGNRIYTRLAVIGGGVISTNDMVVIGSTNTSNDATDKNLANEYDITGVADGSTLRYQAMVNGAYTVFIGNPGVSILPTRVNL